MPKGRKVNLDNRPDWLTEIEVGGYRTCGITWKGETKSLDDWARQIGVSRHTLYIRLFQQGWSPERALTTKKGLCEQHGRTGTVEWKLWLSMKQRCTDVNCKGYERYGGRGIKVCERWLNSFMAFFGDMGERPSPKHTLEREDNDKGYEPGNVIWATRKVQERNTRRNVKLTYDGRTMILEDWARELGLASNTLWNRIRTLGWDVERALTTPAGPNGRKRP